MHQFGVSYGGDQWTIFNQDNGDILVGAAFNVLVYNPLYLPVLLR